MHDVMMTDGFPENISGAVSRLVTSVTHGVSIKFHENKPEQCFASQTKTSQSIVRNRQASKFKSMADVPEDAFMSSGGSREARGDAETAAMSGSLLDPATDMEADV